LLEPVGPGANPAKSRNIFLGTLTLHVKAAGFRLAIFLSRMLRCCGTGCAAMQRDPAPIAGKTTQPNCRACYGVGTAQRRRPIHTEKETNRKECEMRGVIFAAVLVMTATGGARAQDAAAGEKVFAVCKACHQIGETAKNAVGPVLNGIIGRPAGTYPGYSYSDANKNSGLTWDEATFRDYIKDPRAKIPGTKMIYPGLKDEQKTSDLLAYLKQFDADGKKK
jgi:cytochrome c